MVNLLKVAKNHPSKYSVEILPPKVGQGIDTLFKNIELLIVGKGPICINVTYHQQEYNIDTKELKVQAYSLRPGTISVCVRIQERYKIEVVPHLICGGFNEGETQDALIELNFHGIDNILALRGDIPVGLKKFQQRPGGHIYASELVQQIINMNKGIYLGGTTGIKTNFQIGVAGYPEKHFEAPNEDKDIENLKSKIDAGASYIVTQMFFGWEKYEKFVERCTKAGINVPIIPGVAPVFSLDRLLELPSRFYINIPCDFVKNMEIVSRSGKLEMRKVGLEYIINQCEKLLDLGAPWIHFFTINNGSMIREVIQALGGKLFKDCLDSNVMGESPSG